MKNAVKTILKFAFAFGLIYWLINSGKLDLSVLGEAANDPLRMAAGFGFVLLILLLATWRYYLIITEKMENKPSFLKIAKFNWIGMFFNSVLPGSVSGDIVKVFYLKQLDKGLSNRFLFASVLIDRFVGLFGLIIILGLFSIINYDNLSQMSPDIKTLMDINLLLLMGVVFGFFALFFFKELPQRMLAPFERFAFLNKILPKLIDAWENLCMFRHRIIMLTFISMAIQGFTVMNFWYIVHPFADGEFLFRYSFSVVPIGFVAIALPIAPSGLGVGHAVFHRLFEFMDVSNGASLFNIYFVLMLIGNLLGMIPYLMLSRGNRKKINNLEKKANF